MRAESHSSPFRQVRVGDDGSSHARIGNPFNNHFKGDWNGRLKALENAVPTINARAVTDYYLEDKYRQVLRRKLAGRLHAGRQS
jgi:hypothetical protein